MEFARIQSEAELQARLAAEPCCLAAGMTDLYPSGTLQSLTLPLLDISAVPSLRGILEEEHVWRLGATTRWAEIAHFDWPDGLCMLSEAAAQVGAVQVQNAATLAGNLCNASPAADGVPVLLALDASIDLASLNTSRQVPVGEFITGVRQTALARAEYLRAVSIPKPPDHAVSVFLKLGGRAYLVISIAMVAGSLSVDDQGRVSRVGLALGACTPVATRLSAVEAAIMGQPVNPALVDRVQQCDVQHAVRPIDDVRASADYRAKAAFQLVRDAVSLLVERAT
ncbi:MAG: FAD binding domain-containing protein [Pseudomonadota bacterium]